MPRGKQERLPGTVGNNPALEDLAYKYAAARDARMEAGEEEVRLKGLLLAFMQKNKINNYRYEDLTIERISGEESVKVKVAKPQTGKAAGDGKG